jgi:viroplasmin and RNaseH domain-containing protein
MTNEAISVSPKNVLVVDNDISESGWQKRITGWLSNEFKVISVKTYEEALEYLSGQISPFHVVVADISLNALDEFNRDGFNLAAKIKESGEYTQVILLSYSPFSRFSTAIIASIREKTIFGFFEKVPSDEKNFKLDDFLLECKKAAEEAEKARKQDLIDIFVVMPFAKEFNLIYHSVKEVADKMGKICKRADQNLTSESNNIIMSDIHYGIQHSDVIVAELSGGKPNTFFEAGISYAWQKKIVFIADESEKEGIPDILSQHRIIFYQKQWGGETELKKNLSERFKEEFPKLNKANKILTKVDPSMYFAITSPMEDGRDTYTALIKKSMGDEIMESIYLWDEKVWHKFGTELSKSTLIEKKLREAAFVVADLSGDDPIAFYLAGMAYGLNKKYKFMYRKDQKPPFDITGLNLLRHSKFTEAEREEARHILREVMRAYRDEVQGASSMMKTVDTDARLEYSQEREAGKMRSKVKVFLNHATEDKPLVRTLYSELKKHPWIVPWIDDEQLLPGQDLELEIDKAMNESDAVLVCISRTSLNKTGYVQAEIRKAEEQQRLRPQGAIYMIPVLLEPCKEQVPPNLQKLLWVDISDSSRINSIIKSLETLRK